MRKHHRAIRIDTSRASRPLSWRDHHLFPFGGANPQLRFMRGTPPDGTSITIGIGACGDVAETSLMSLRLCACYLGYPLLAPLISRCYPLFHPLYFSAVIARKAIDF